jgi:CheY-specific phosphatase CheX
MGFTMSKATAFHGAKNENRELKTMVRDAIAELGNAVSTNRRKEQKRLCRQERSKFKIQLGVGVKV